MFVFLNVITISLTIALRASAEDTLSKSLSKILGKLKFSQCSIKDINKSFLLYNDDK